MKSNVSVQWKKIVGVAITAVAAVSAVTAITLLNSYKWDILSSIGFTDMAGRNTLHIAVERGNKQVVERLLSKGVDVNAKNYDGNTPLHLADDLDVVKLLIAKGADVNAKNNHDRTPVQERQERETARRENHQ